MTQPASAVYGGLRPAQRGPLSLLLVEDSPQDAELISAWLADGGLVFDLTRVDSHAGFNAAIAQCRFDLILSDYNVPGFDGMAALAAAHLACPDVPFLFVSGALGEERAIELLKRGATDYILKDRLERLVPSVERALREAHEKKERRLAEERLRQRAEFEQQLLGIVSHDLRNPLNAIVLGAATLLKREGLDEKSTQSVRRILRSADRATRMIRDLLDFTQVRLGGGIPVEVKPLDLHAHAEHVLEELEHSHAEHRLMLTQEGDTRGEWDPDRIAQVITNLVGNALKYSPPGTPVGVRTRGEGDTVLFEVHNQGAPIAAELLPALFKPLSRGAGKVDMETRSIGLGLYIVESIVRAHGGSIEVRSTQEEGTRFTVRLPRSLRSARGG
ncbi:MAG TPA: ATP-binding protein [Hyalangium sp.]|nr:ATP-binding protein [Hyalangium sp.]